MASTDVVDLKFLEDISGNPIPPERIDQYEYAQVSYVSQITSTPVLITVGKHKDDGHTAVSPYDYRSLCLALGRKCTIPAPAQLTALEVSEVKIDTPKMIRALSLTLPTLPQLPLIFDGEVCVSHVLALLRWIPGLEDIDYAYHQKMDTGVTSERGAAVLKQNRPDYPKGTRINESGLACVQIHSTSTMVSAAYAVLLMITKGINPAAPDHMNQFLKRRLAAFAHTIGVMGRRLEWSIIQPLFIPGELEMLNTQLSYFPLMKRSVFVPIVNQYTPITQHMNQIFRESSMTIFSVIYEMYTSEIVTLLHIHSIILPELQVWIQTIDTLCKQYGTAWMFYKLLDPTGSLTSIKRFRTLGCAAISWKKVNSDLEGQQTLGQLQGVRVNQRFERLAGIHLPAEYCGSDTRSNIELLKTMTTCPFIKIRWNQIAKAVEEGNITPGEDF